MGETSFALYECLEDLINSMPAAQLVIDMPMGLPETTPRDLESKARKLIPGRASSLFGVPARSAIYATSYQQACDKNLAAFGKKISLQSWYICHKIKQLDQCLLNTPERCETIYESHPELCFSLLARSPMQHSKKTEPGIEERLVLLESLLPDARARYLSAVNDFPRKALARDDIVDAMVLFAISGVPQKVLPDTQAADERGVPIRMLLPAFADSAK